MVAYQDNTLTVLVLVHDGVLVADPALVGEGLVVGTTQVYVHVVVQRLMGDVRLRRTQFARVIVLELRVTSTHTVQCLGDRVLVVEGLILGPPGVLPGHYRDRTRVLVEHGPQPLAEQPLRPLLV